MSFNRSFSHINFTFLNITMTPIPHVGKKHVFVPIAPVNVSVSLINIEQNGHTWCHCATVINRPFVNICSDERTSYITDFTGSVWMESKLGPFSTTGKSSWHRRQYMTIWPDRFKTGLCQYPHLCFWNWLWPHCGAIIARGMSSCVCLYVTQSPL